MAKARKKITGAVAAPEAAPAAIIETRCWLIPAIWLGLAAMTFAVFGQTLGHPFIDFDDNQYVYDNPMVSRGLTAGGMVWAFTHFYADNWHPLTWISHMLDCEIFGLHPWGHHLTSVLIHAAAVIGLFLALRQMTGFLWRSAFVAAVFAVHPLRAESVAWVAERKDVLSGLFFVLTISAYARYVRGPRSAASYGMVALLLALGLMCKPMLVTLPLVLLLLDYWPLQRTESARKLIIEKLPLLALSAAASVPTLLAQHGAMAEAGSHPLALRLANAAVSACIYLRQMIWPAGLAAAYPYPRDGLPAGEMVLAVLLLAGISALAWARRRAQPWLLVGWSWYLIMLLPVLGIIQVGMQAHADRYTYLPQIGICLAIAWMAARFIVNRIVLGTAAALALVLLACGAWKQTAYWRNSETLWARTLACTTDNEVAQYNLANALRDNGKTDEAITHYQEAVRIDPRYSEAFVNLATAFLQSGKADQAVAADESALQIDPKSAMVHCDLGNALRQSGKIPEAAAQYEAALQINSKYAPARADLGNLLLQAGRVDDAIGAFREAVQDAPEVAAFHYDLGNALRQTKGGLAEAISQYQTALQIAPGYPDAHLNLGTAFGQQGKMVAAAAEFQQALQAAPNDPRAQNNLAWILATSADPSLRDGAKAVELAQQANTGTGGKDPVVLHTFAAALAEAGRFPEAVQTAQLALRHAQENSNAGLARILEPEIKLYQAGKTAR